MKTPTMILMLCLTAPALAGDEETEPPWILYNRFQAEQGNGVYAKTGSFDHIIRGNVFVLKDPKAALVQLASPDCIGVEILANQFYGGNGKILSGKAAAGTVEGNQIHPLGDAPRPKPPVPSIYEWQQKRGER